MHVDEKLGKGYVWVDKLLMKPMARRDAWMSMFCQLYPAMKLGMVAVIIPVNSFGVKAVYIRPYRIVERALARKLTKSPVLQQHWHSGEPPGIANPGPVFEPRAPIEGASCAP